mgnify:CR=1 FL=1
MTTKQAHASTPWVWGSHESVSHYFIYREGQMPGEDGIAVVKDLSDVEFIVRACNSHDALVEAASGALMWMENNLMASDVSGLEDRKSLRAALALAQGKVTP